MVIVPFGQGLVKVEEKIFATNLDFRARASRGERLVTHNGVAMHFGSEGFCNDGMDDRRLHWPP